MSYVLLFFAALLAEVASVVIVSGWLGAWTLLVLAAAFGLGVLVLSGRGLAIMRDVGRAVTEGGSPAPAIVDGALIAGAGVLLIIPGFVSDVVALALLIPPVRAPLRTRLIGGLKAKLQHHGVVGDVGHGGGAGDVIDVEASEVATPTPARPRLSE